MKTNISEKRKKTRNGIPYKKTCLTAPYHFFTPLSLKKRWKSSRNLGTSFSFQLSGRLCLVGVHLTYWEDLQQQLPGGKLFGSTATTCKRFEHKKPAVGCYKAHNKDEAEPVFHGC